MRYAYGEPFSTTAAEISRNFGNWQDKAMVGPVIVTHHGRARVVLVSAEHFATWREGGNGKSDGAGGLTFETNLSAVLDHMADGFYALDHDLRFIALNGAACDFLGQSRDQLIGGCITDRFPDLEGSMLVDRIKRVMRSGFDQRFESTSTVFPGRTSDVSIFPYPGGVGVLFRNTTDQHRYEAALRENRSLVRAIGQSSHLALFKLNVRGAPVEVTEMACKMIGLKREEILKSRFVDLFTLPSRPAVHHALEEALQHGEASVVVARLYAGGDGDLEVEMSLAPVADDLGTAGVMVLATPNCRS